MILNATLMHGLRENRTSRFYWLTQPLKTKTDYHAFYEESPVMDKLSPVVRSQIKCCAHEQSCDTFIFEVNFNFIFILKLFVEFGFCHQNNLDIQGHLNSMNIIISNFLILGNLEIFQVWSWFGNCSQHYRQL